MDPFSRNPPADTLAAARLHVQALTECGLPREALLRALLENYGPPSEARRSSQVPLTSGRPIDSDEPGETTPTMETAFGQPSQQQQHQHQHQHHQPVQGKMSQAAYNARLSVSTTSSRSSGRASVMSTATSMSSVSSQHDGMAPFPPPPPATPAVKSNNRGTSKPQGAYWCTFCDVAFQRKFDWKRHEDEFHERYKRYPCPSCNRIFWGANTFNQHHKNAHGCTTCPHADRVVQYTQRKQAWACGFCGGFLASRDRYFDHVARHYEDGCTKAHWNHSLVIYGLLHQPIITHAWKELFPSLYGHLPRDQQPVLEWDVKATGHAQGFLEGESPGKLQDLLEFFSDSRDDPRFLARLAHDQAIIRLRHELPASTAPTTPAPRPISEPPKPTMSKQLPAVSSSKHLSAPQPPADMSQQYDHRLFLKKQRSLAPAPSAFPSSHLLRSQSQHLQHQPQSNNPFLSSFPQTIIETPETNPFFSLPSTAHTSSSHIHHHSQSSHHHHHHHQQQQQQQQPHHSLTVPTTISENLFDDWSSLTTTVVDEAAYTMTAGDGWDGDTNMDLASPGHG
ncbi:hypothetical protein B0T25DRAFT_33604 [Lasiosphaeria hispida]|uniref:C2H2-type domain-containing protein n=1 Tax=Lasiosphaeria hispida TaxID=260671 RepID=A0AAJ0MK07_9PEZI|nr:hypothetical protein B0T25DRAFT_33604 [Lasiosphaeria hispida]